MKKYLPHYRKQAQYRCLTLAYTSIIAFNSLTAQATSFNLHDQILNFTTNSAPNLVVKFDTNGREELLKLKLKTFVDPIERLEFAIQSKILEDSVLTDVTNYIIENISKIGDIKISELIFPKTKEGNIDYSKVGQGLVLRMDTNISKGSELLDKGINHFMNNDFLKFETERESITNIPILELVDKETLARVLKARIEAKIYGIENSKPADPKLSEATLTRAEALKKKEALQAEKDLEKKKRKIFRNSLKDLEGFDGKITDDQIDRIIKITCKTLITKYVQLINNTPETLLLKLKDRKVPSPGAPAAPPPGAPAAPPPGAPAAPIDKAVITQSMLSLSLKFELNEAIKNLLNLENGAASLAKGAKKTTVTTIIEKKTYDAISVIAVNYKKKVDELKSKNPNPIRLELELPNVLITTFAEVISNRLKKTMDIDSKNKLIEYLTLKAKYIEIDNVLKKEIALIYNELKTDDYFKNELTSSTSFRKIIRFNEDTDEKNQHNILEKLRALEYTEKFFEENLLTNIDRTKYLKISLNKISNITDRIVFALAKEMSKEEIKEIAKQLINEILNNKINFNDQERLLFPQIKIGEAKLDYSKIGDGIIQNLKPYSENTQKLFTKLLDENFLHIILRNNLGPSDQNKIISYINDKKQLLKVILVIINANQRAIDTKTSEKEFVSSITSSLKAIYPNITSEEVTTLIKISNTSLLKNFVKSVNSSTVTFSLQEETALKPPPLSLQEETALKPPPLSLLEETALKPPPPPPPPSAPQSLPSGSNITISGELAGVVNNKLAEFWKLEGDKITLLKHKQDLLKAKKPLKVTFSPSTEIGKAYEKTMVEQSVNTLDNAMQRALKDPDIIKNIILRAIILKLREEFPDINDAQIIESIGATESNVSKKAYNLYNDYLEQIKTDEYLIENLISASYTELGTTAPKKTLINMDKAEEPSPDDIPVAKKILFSTELAKASKDISENEGENDSDSEKEEGSKVKEAVISSEKEDGSKVKEAVIGSEKEEGSKVKEAVIGSEKEEGSKVKEAVIGSEKEEGSKVKEAVIGSEKECETDGDSEDRINLTDIEVKEINSNSPLILEEFQQLPKDSQQELLSTLIGSVIFSYPELFDLVNEYIHTRSTAIAAGDDEIQSIKGLWVGGIYGASKQGAKAKANGYKSKSAGFSIGFDLGLEDDLLGVAYSNLRSSFKTYPFNISSRIEVESHIFSLYGLKKLRRNFTLQTAISVSRSNISNKASTIQGNNKILNSKYKNTSYNFDVKLNYLIANNSGLNIIPNIGINYGSYKDDSYTDNTLAINNFSIAAKSNKLLSCSIGTKVLFPKQTIKLITLTLSLHADIIKNINSKSQKISTKLFQSGKTITNDVIIPRNSDLGYNLGARLLTERKNIKLQIQYNCKLQKKYQSHQGSLNIKILF